MAVIENHRTTADIFAGFSHFAASTLAAISDWNDARITRKSLSKLSARELDDIGLNYGDIDSIAARVVR